MEIVKSYIQKIQNLFNEVRDYKYNKHRSRANKVIGKLFKGPKLIKISPNKTYSGSIGSYLFSLLITLFFLTNTNYGFDTQFSITTYTVVLIILGSTVSQIGDLVISYFKRMSKIKNTGNLIPGHGGILDRIDGMIFTFPFFYTLLIINDFRLN